MQKFSIGDMLQNNNQEVGEIIEIEDDHYRVLFLKDGAHENRRGLYYSNVLKDAQIKQVEKIENPSEFLQDDLVFVNVGCGRSIFGQYDKVHNAVISHYDSDSDGKSNRLFYRIESCTNTIAFRV